MKVIVITKDGTPTTLAKWQADYGLKPDQIGKYFSLSEARFKQDMDEYGEIVVNELLMRVLDAFREEIKRPISINSFNRTEDHQKALKARGFRAATYSPHVVKMAADIDTHTAQQSKEYASVMQRVSVKIGIKVRVGVDDYIKAGQTFIHVDVCPEYYAPGKPFHGDKHPVQWEKPITW